jgi:hypothetical protein
MLQLESGRGKQMRALLKKPSTIIHRAAAALCLTIAAACISLPAMAATKDVDLNAPPVTLDPVQSLLNQPMIPMPDVSNNASGGNREAIARSYEAQLKNCELYREQARQRNDEMKKLRAQRVNYHEYFKKVHEILAPLHREYRLARIKLERFKARKMDPAQIALVQRQVDELKKRYDEEYARLRSSQINYEKVLERELYFKHLESYFPKCYKKYTGKPDANISRFLAAVKQQKRKQPQATQPTTQPAATPDQRFVPRKSAQ